MTLQDFASKALIAATLTGAFLCVTAPAGTAQTAPAPGLTVAVHLGGSGSESVAVSGMGPAASTIDIELWASFSRDLPSVHLASVRTVSDGSGHFAAVVPTAPATVAGTTFSVTARALLVPGQPAASASTAIGAPGAYNAFWDAEE